MLMLTLGKHHFGQLALLPFLPVLSVRVPLATPTVCCCLANTPLVFGIPENAFVHRCLMQTSPGPARLQQGRDGMKE